MLSLKQIFQMSYPHLIVFIFLVFDLNAQINTEVYLFDIDTANGKVELKNMRNVSNNEGYDNQPSFIYEETLLFSGNNKGQTDIALYDIQNSKRSWLNKSTTGGEYSPQKLPIGEDVASVRLDTNGLQRLYLYNQSYKEPKLILNDLQVAYFFFYTANLVVSAVLGNDDLDLVISDISEKKNDTLLVNVGRSIHGVPYQKYVSYTAVNNEKNHDLYLFDIDGDMESYFVCQLPIGVQDYTWLNEDQIIIGRRNKIFVYDLLEDSEWREWASLEGYDFTNITRLAVSPEGTKLALVAELLNK